MFIYIILTTQLEPKKKILLVLNLIIIKSNSYTIIGSL